jgi:uncharacterized protein YciI
MREQDGWDEHAHFMDELTREGFIVLAGPVRDEAWALLVCEAESADAVHRRLDEDPWTASGHLETGSVEPWTILLDRDSPPS